MYRASGWRLFERDHSGMANSRGIVLRHRVMTLIVAVGTLALTVILFIAIPKGFFPVQDTGVILGISEGPQDTSLPTQPTAALADRSLRGSR